MNKTLQKLTINAISIALVLLFTSFINIRLPFMGNGGLIHLGNVPLFLTAIIFGRKTGFLAGAVGMAFFDFLCGWTAWVPFTFVIVGLMGYTVGIVSEKTNHNKKAYYTVAMIFALFIKVIGYYIAEVLLYGNFYAPLGSVSGNVIQVILAMIIVLPIVDPLNRAVQKFL